MDLRSFLVIMQNIPGADPEECVKIFDEMFSRAGAARQGVFPKRILMPKGFAAVTRETSEQARLATHMYLIEKFAELNMSGPN